MHRAVCGQMVGQPWNCKRVLRPEVPWCQASQSVSDNGWYLVILIFYLWKACAVTHKLNDFVHSFEYRWHKR